MRLPISVATVLIASQTVMAQESVGRSIKEVEIGVNGVKIAGSLAELLGVGAEEQAETISVDRITIVGPLAEVRQRVEEPDVRVQVAGSLAWVFGFEDRSEEINVDRVLIVGSLAESLNDKN